jgi:DinB superfamily
MLRSEINPLPEYFDRYINMTDDVELLEAIQISLNELDNAPVEKWKALGDKVYEPGKWTILQHIIDTERIFSYRMVAASRAETQTMPYFTEDEYAAHAKANRRDLNDLIAELKLVRLSVQALYKSFDDEMLQRICKGFSSEYSVAAIGFMIPGHQRWHFKVLEERYYPLLSNG